MPQLSQADRGTVGDVQALSRCHSDKGQERAKGDLETAIGLVKAMGGTKALRKALDAYQEVCRPIDALDGPERAREILTQLEELRTL